MKEIIIGTLLSGLFLIGFIITLIVGLVKKQKRMLAISTGALLITIGTGFYSGYLFLTKSYQKITETFRARTGEEIYEALFEKPQFNCVKIRNYQDQVVPKIDYAIWLHFDTCPDEVQRILSQQTYELEKSPTKELNTDGPAVNETWFKPEVLGDTILIYKYKADDYGNGQTIYLNLQRTEAYCMDVFD